jgi:hypothetical protein
MEEEVILKVWDHNGLSGYVFISTGMRELGQKKCTQGTWKDQAFKWPEQRDEIIPYIKDQEKLGKDVYWAPHIFEQPRRLAEYALPVKCMHSDLDEALPPSNYPPTILWESSPKRYAAVWLLDDYLPVKEFEAINQKFNYDMGADKNCWNPPAGRPPGRRSTTCSSKARVQGARVRSALTTRNAGRGTPRNAERGARNAELTRNGEFGSSK